jgi:hypothetical protein
MAKLAGISTSSVTESQTPLEIWEVLLDSSTIKFNVPLLISPTILDKGTSEECYFAELPEIGISAVGVDIDELRSCLHSDIRMTWKRVFRKPISKLTPKDAAIRQRLLELTEEINNE